MDGKNRVVPYIGLQWSENLLWIENLGFLRLFIGRKLKVSLHILLESYAKLLFFTFIFSIFKAYF